MDWKMWSRLLGLALLLCICLQVFAQYSGSNQEVYEGEEIEERKIDDESWKKATEGINYDGEPQVEAEEKSEPSSFSLPNFGPILQILFYAGLLVLLVYLIIKIVGGNLFIPGKNVSGIPEYILKDLEENIHETDLERLLREALEQGDFRMAIRIHFLMIIKELSERNWIRWKKDKTNYEYLIEMRSRKEHDTFMKIMHIFERVWYGDAELHEKDFQVLSTEFSSFKNNVVEQG